MLKRLWWVLSVLWAFVFIANGLTKEHGLQAPDIAIAGAPLVGAAALALRRYGPLAGAQVPCLLSLSRKCRGIGGRMRTRRKHA